MTEVELRFGQTAAQQKETVMLVGGGVELHKKQGRTQALVLTGGVGRHRGPSSRWLFVDLMENN